MDAALAIFWLSILGDLLAFGIGASKTTLQKLRDEGKIRYSQPEKKIILYDLDSIHEYLNKTQPGNFLTMEEQEQLYTKGFNNGYLLAKHEPELAAQLTAKTNDHSDYFKGLTGGKEQYEKEAREWAKSFSKGSPGREDRDIDRER